MLLVLGAPLAGRHTHDLYDLGVEQGDGARLKCSGTWMEELKMALLYRPSGTRCQPQG